MFQIAEMLSIPVSEVAVRYDFFKFKRFFYKTILSSIKGPYRPYFTFYFYCRWTEIEGSKLNPISAAIEMFRKVSLPMTAF